MATREVLVNPPEEIRGVLADYWQQIQHIQHEMNLVTMTYLSAMRVSALAARVNADGDILITIEDETPEELERNGNPNRAQRRALAKAAPEE